MTPGKKILARFGLMIVLLAALFFTDECVAQVSGCTDPLSNNYNPAATINDASCTYNITAYTPPVKVDPLSDLLYESSGLQVMGNHLWSFNDSRGGATFYRIDTVTKTVLQTVSLAGAQNID